MHPHHWWLSLALATALLVLLALGAKAYRDGAAAASHAMVERMPVDADVVCYRVDGRWAGCARVWPTMGPLPRPRWESGVQ